MKFKKITAFVFTLMLLFFYATSICSSANSEAPNDSFSLRFSLLAEDGSQVVMAERYDLITVSFVMERTDAKEAYTTNGFQNYIYYDLSFFELVEDSIVCYDTGAASAKKQSSITYGEILQCQNMSNSYEPSFVFCTFQLKIIGKSGSGKVSSAEVYAFDSNYRAVTVEQQNLQVIIDSNCSHKHKRKVEAKSATCTEDGWNAYYVCDSCEVLLDENAEKLIADIPYVKAAHSTAGVAPSYNEQGHWYECNKCGEFVNNSAHYGGEATCTDRAKCEICEQEYGTVNADVHDGKTEIKNKKEALNFTNGYTGDVYCTDCGEIIQKGEVVPSPLTYRTLLVILFVVILVSLGINSSKDE